MKDDVADANLIAMNKERGLSDALRADTPDAPAETDPSLEEDARRSSRRAFLGRSARRAAYVTPVVLLFKPSQALAGSGGTQITQP